MTDRTGHALTLLAAAGLLVAGAAGAHAAEVGFLEMLFGARQAPQPVQAAPAADRGGAYLRTTRRISAARKRLHTRYTALPVKIHVKEEASERQTPLDMKAGAAAAFMKDETLRKGDIVVLGTGARVFTGRSSTHHAMSDFEPVQRAASVSKPTRKLLAGMMTPVGALPADEARRAVARLHRAGPAALPEATQASAAGSATGTAITTVSAVAGGSPMRVIYPWRTTP